MANLPEEHKNDSNCLDRVIKVQVQDAEKPKDFYINYFDAPGIRTGNFKEDTMLLDGLKKYVYIEFEESKGARDMCLKNHDVKDNIVSVCMATGKEQAFYYNVISVHGLDFSDNENLRLTKDI
ncbi:uncharacterized protein LOC101848340 [Aplysia californica]|uniref:Uncharacterized protein LOC101848340 n=1 Tax=Aplysia californica TaxID=6500 RepID=A0ABM0JIM9_APLCA|nr:uncharacterized protein LOC101848340 [Aplysia californica]XP_035824672.1 uncharacterized protein LOC101848340 [Aplysia californica]